MTRPPTAPEGGDAPGRTTAEQVRDAYERGTRATVLALVMSAALAVIKIAAGFAGNSYALVADGVESVLDLLSSVLVWGGLRMSASPQTAEFPYGRGKAEPLAAMAVAAVLLAAAVGIAYGAVVQIRTPHRPPAAFTLVVLVLVVVGKELLYRVLAARSAEVGSHALQTDAWHHRSDALTSAAAFVGISLALLMGDDWAEADDWAALGACLVIAWNGTRLFRAGLREVLDAAAPAEVHERVRSLAASVPGVHDIDKLRVRRSGLVYLVDIHVEVDGSLTVRRGHEIGHAVKDRLIASELPILDVLVHIEPPYPGG